MASEYRKAKALVDAWAAREVTLHALGEGKTDLRALFQHTDWRGMREKAVARQEIDALLQTYACTKESQFEAAWERQNSVADVAEGGGVRAAEDTSADLADRRVAEELAAREQATTTLSAPIPTILADDYRRYEELLPLATYGSGMSAKVLQLCADFDGLRSRVETLLYVTDADVEGSSGEVVEESGSDEQKLRSELRLYILEAAEDPEVARERAEQAERRKRQKVEEERLNREARAGIQKADAARQLAEEAALYDLEKMLEREARWADAAAADGGKGPGSDFCSVTLLNDAFSQLLRTHTLQELKAAKLPALRTLVEALAQKPETHPNVLRLENSDFQKDLGSSMACRQFLFGLGYRRVADEAIESNGTVFARSRGPYYFLPEPDPLEDFEKYAGWTEFFEKMLGRLNEIQRMVHDFASAANNDRIAAELFGAGFKILKEEGCVMS
eukprot:g6212.t1